jgi:glycosyltransferase involved in cell wall biosynthesis
MSYSSEGKDDYFPVSMRIGFDSKRAFNNATGLGNYSRFVIASMVKAYPQHEYFLFTPYLKEEFRDFISPNANVHIVTPQSIVGKVLPSMWRTYAIADECNKLGLDVFHGLSNELPVGISRFKGKKIVTIHDLIFLRYPRYYNNIDRYIYRKKFSYACSQANTIVAASLQTKADISTFFGTAIAIGENKITVVYQDCDARFAQQLSAEEKSSIGKTYGLPATYILSVGTVEKRKDQLTLLKAFHALGREDLHLWIVGRHTAYMKDLDEFIHANDLARKVKFLSNVAQEDLPGIFQQAMLFVYASEFEGFGIPVLEGLRSGVPVIAANTSSLPEVGGYAALYFEKGNAHGLAEKMKMALDDPAKRREMVEAGYEQAGKFETRKLVGQLESLYRQT